MATPAELRRQIRALIDTLEPSVAAAFDQAVRDIRSSIVLNQVVAALEAGNVAGAVALLNIEPAAFAPLADAITAAYNQGGRMTSLLMPTLKDLNGNKVVFRWDVRIPRAEQEIREFAARMVTFVSEETKEAARESILRDFEQGKGPKQIGLNLSGRVSRVTGKREGGIVGLSRPQAEASANMRVRLLSGDPAEMRKVLDMKLRDKRFDKAVKKAIDTGKPVPAADAEKMVSRYNDKAVRRRGEVIARTETGDAVMKAKHESTRQGLEKANLTETAVKRKWRDSRDKRVRHDHALMNGKTVTGLSEPFVLPDGSRMMHPMDASLGAPLRQRASCRCDEEIVFDFSQGLR